MSNTLATKTIAELAPLLETKQVSPVEVTEAILERVEQLDEYINAHIRVDGDEAREAAKQAEQEIAAGRYKGKLHGIPMALKDIFYEKGKVVTMGSKVHQHFVPNHDATVVEKLKKAGVILTGSLNMHEYAWGGTTNNPHFGPTRNPWNRDHIPGGSSGGSGAALAADLTIASLGTDTAGSVRIPASACGVVGLKPTHGRVSKYGVFPLAWSLDHVGPMTKTVEDAAIILEAITGYDPKDPTSINQPIEPYSSAKPDHLKGVVIGIEKDYFLHLVQPEVEKIFHQAIETLKILGAEIKPIKIHSLKHTFFAELITIMAESAAIHHKNLKERPEDFGDDVRLNLETGELLTAVDYVQAQQIRQQMKQEFREIFQTVDAIVAPTLPFTAPEIGQQTIVIQGQELSVDAELIRFTSPANLTGFPSISIPAGLGNHLPVNIQFFGDAFAERKIIQVAHAFEQTNPLQGKKPELDQLLTKK